MNKIKELKAAYEAATPGKWRYADDLSAVVVMGKYALKSVADFGKIDGSAPDAAFIALAHNAMPELLEAMWSLEYITALCLETDMDWESLEQATKAAKRSLGKLGMTGG